MVQKQKHFGNTYTSLPQQIMNTSPEELDPANLRGPHSPDLEKLDILVSLLLFESKLDVLCVAEFFTI